MVFAHNSLEAMYAYLGMALQGEILQGLFGELRVVFVLFFIIGFLWFTSLMMFRGEASKILLYLVFALAAIALLGRTMVVDSQAPDNKKLRITRLKQCMLIWAWPSRGRSSRVCSAS